MFGANAFGWPYFGQAYGQPTSVDIPFISSVTVVYAPTLPALLNVPFIGSVTAVFPPRLNLQIPFISSDTVVYTPTIQLSFVGDGVSQVTLELIMAYNEDAHIGGRS